MANLQQGTEESKETLVTEKPQKGSSTTKKIIIFGIPIIIFQIIVVYFLTIKFLMPLAGKEVEETENTEEEIVAETGDQAEQHIFIVKDMIINPAGTNGTRFLLTTIGIEVLNNEGIKELQTKEFQLRDVLNTVFANKEVPELLDVKAKESMKSEILDQIRKSLKTDTPKNIYFSKFIIQ